MFDEQKEATRTRLLAAVQQADARVIGRAAERLKDVTEAAASRGVTNALLALICALLGLQLVGSHPKAMLPRRVMAETTRLPSRSADAPQPVYLVSGPAGGRVDMLPVGVVYLDKNGSLENAVSPDGWLRVRTVP